MSKKTTRKGTTHKTPDPFKHIEVEPDGPQHVLVTCHGCRVAHRFPARGSDDRLYVNLFKHGHEIHGTAKWKSEHPHGHGRFPPPKKDE